MMQVITIPEEFVEKLYELVDDTQETMLLLQGETDGLVAFCATFGWPIGNVSCAE